MLVLSHSCCQERLSCHVTQLLVLVPVDCMVPVYHEQPILVVLVTGLVTGEVSAVMCCRVYPCYK